MEMANKDAVNKPGRSTHSHVIAKRMSSLKQFIHSFSHFMIRKRILLWLLFVFIWYIFFYYIRYTILTTNYPHRQTENNTSLFSAIKDSLPKPKMTYFSVTDNRLAKSANCPALCSPDAKTQSDSSGYTDYKALSHNEEWYINLAKNCTNFLMTRKYILHPVTDEESRFPLAYSLLIFKDIGQVERLLRAIYRPQNYYCIHIDSKSDRIFKIAFSLIAECLPNVFLTSRQIDVVWGSFTVLEPELVCMEALWTAGKWKYFINLTGQEFPLKTNWDLVKILTAYNGSNNMEGTVKRLNKDRLGTYPVPYGMTITKGSVHIVVSRAFVDYVLHSEPAKALLEWAKHASVPDEFFFSTLNHNPQLGIPGAYKGIPETDTAKYRFLTRFKNWGGGSFDWPCGGQRVRLVCVFGVTDLPLLVSRPELFANKFYYDYQPQTLDCLEEWHYNRTRDEYMGLLTFNASDYAAMDFVENSVHS